MTAAAGTDQSPESAPSSPRIAYLDNARFWAMILVVVGHPLFHFISLSSGRAVYYWIYLVHMPLFALLSGYISRNFRATPQQIERTVSTLVIPYFLIEPLYQVLHRHYRGTSDPYMLLSPKWIAWFLAALFIWRLSTPIWRNLRHPILVSILISLLVPLTEVPNVLALPKALGMLPFYVIGMHMTMERFQRLSAARVRIVSIVFLAAVATVSALYSRGWDVSWTKWRHRYSESALSVGPWEGMALRSVLIVVGVLMCLAILSLVPWKQSWTSPLGERTLYCYLLHGFVVLLLAEETHVFAELRALGWVGLAVTVAAAAVVAVLLMTKPVAMLFRPLFEANLNWAFKSRDRLPA
ncbi:MAG: acyltransferase family protein [Aeromicrobium sp.]